jgi:hypothetical protein
MIVILADACNCKKQAIIYMLARKLNLRENWNFLVIRYAYENYRLIIDPKPMLKHN